MVISVADLEAQIIRKPIKHLRIAVCPPDAGVEVSAPLEMDEDVIRLALIHRLTWLRTERKNMLEQLRLGKHTYESGESHYFRGKRYLLKIVEVSMGKPHGIVLRGKYMEMHVYASTTPEARNKLLQGWYRSYLKSQLEEKLPLLAAKIGVPVPKYRIRKMRTCWGTCNKGAQNIQINTDLAMKLPSGLEYVLVHELCHLVEASHNDKFIALLSRFCPNWRYIQSQLNAEPLSYETGWAL